nr:retrotransposon Gag domain, retroviral aspartyl protease [Tanacetum cinerariifolium]
MLTSKWHTLNHNCQKFNTIFKRCKRLGKSGEKNLDVMKRARTPYRGENKEKPFTQEDAWDILKNHSKWDAPSLVDLTGSEQDHVPGGSHEELFGEDARPRPSGKAPAESAYEVAKEKDRTVMRLEEMKFLAISTKDLSEDDAYWINVQKQQIKDISAKLEAFETMKEDIAALKEGSRSRRNGEGESSWRGRQPQRPYNKIDFPIF